MTPVYFWLTTALAAGAGGLLWRRKRAGRAARRALRLAQEAYAAGRWGESLGAYRDYLRRAAATVAPAAAEEILRYMAFAVGEGEFRADLWSVKKEFKQLAALGDAPAGAANRGKRRAALARLRTALAALEFVPDPTAPKPENEFDPGSELPPCLLN